MIKTNSDVSLRLPLRLLIDEIVEDLSRSGSECRNRWVQETKLLDAAGSYRVRRDMGHGRESRKILFGHPYQLVFLFVADNFNPVIVEQLKLYFAFGKQANKLQ